MHAVSGLQPSSSTPIAGPEMAQYQDRELNRHAAEHLGEPRICGAITDGNVTATLPAPFQSIIRSRLIPGPVQYVQHSEHHRLDPRGM